MASLNKVLLIGRLGQDPEKRILESGATVVNFSLATSEKWTDKQGQKQEKTEWHRVVFWNKQADIIADNAKKGEPLYVEGSIETDEYTDKDGNRRFATKIKGRNFQFLGGKSGGGEGGQQPSHPQNYGGGQTEQAPISDDSIPF